MIIIAVTSINIAILIIHQYRCRFRHEQDPPSAEYRRHHASLDLKSTMTVYPQLIIVVTVTAIIFGSVHLHHSAPSL